jgi:hypothetical protein
LEAFRGDFEFEFQLASLQGVGESSKRRLLTDIAQSALSGAMVIFRALQLGAGNRSVFVQNKCE